MGKDNYLKKELYELVKTDERIFDFIQEGSLDGLWYWDLENPENRWMNSRYWKVLGYDPDKMPHKASAWQNIINQDDLKVANENLSKHCENPSHPYDQVVRYTHKDGSTVWIRCRGLAIRDQNGSPIRMLGAHQDISDIKNREQELIKAKDNAEEASRALEHFHDLMQYIIDHVESSVAVHDKEYKYIYVNNNYLEEFNLKRKDIIGKHHYDVFPDLQQVWKDAHKRALAGEVTGDENTPVYVDNEVVEWTRWECRPWYEKDKSIGGFIVYIEDITKRKKFENKLRESESRFRQVSEVAEELIWEIDTNGLYTYVSPVIKSLLGYIPDEIVGKKYFYDLFIPEKREEFKQSAFELISNQEIVKDFDNTLLHKDGHRVYVSTSGSPIFGDNGNLKGYRGIDIDITERKKAEEAARKSAELAEKQRNLIAELSFSDAVVNGNIEQALELVTTKLAKTLQVDRVSVWLLSEEDSVLQRQILFDASHGIESQIEVLNTTDIPSYFKAMRRDSIVIAEDAQNNPSTKELADHYLIPLQISSLLDTAIQQEGQLKGVLSAEHRGSIRHWHSDEVSFLSAISNLIAQLYANAERKKAEDKLRESESRFRKIYENPANGMVLAGSDLKFFMANQGFCQMTGYQEEELKELTFNDITHPADIAKDMAEAKKMMTGEIDAYRIEKRYIKKNGQTIWVDLSVSPIYDLNDQLQYFIGIVSDITRRKKAELKNLELQEKFERISLHLPGVIYQFRLKPDGSFQFPYASPGVYDIYGVNPEEVEDDATAAFSVLHPDDLEQVRASINYSAQTLTPWHDIYRVNHPRGETIWVEGHATPEKLDDGSIIWHGYIQDITKRKQAENSLKELEAKQRKMIANIGDVITIIEEKGVIQYMSPNCEEIFGWKPEELVDISVWKLVHPDDLERGKSFFSYLLNKPNETATIELRYKQKNGDYGYIEFTGVNLLKDPDINGILGNYQDITERKKAESQLRLQSNMLNAVGQAVIGTNPEGIITYFNQAAEELYGWPKTQAIGQNLIDVTVPQTSKTQAQEIMEALTANQNWSGEFMAQNRAGKMFPAFVHNSPVIDDKGKLVGIIGISEDISDRKKSEEKLKLYNRALEASSVSVVITDSNGAIEYTNPFFTETTGYTLDELRGEHPRILQSGKQTEAFYEDLWNTITTGKDWSGQFQNMKKNGELFWESAVISPIKDSDTGQITHFVAIKEDITELLVKEDQIKQSLREKEVLLSEVHHRVKNNLAVVSGMMQLQSFDEENPEVQEKLSESISRINTIGKIHEKLYQHETFSSIDLAENIRDLTHEIVDMLSSGTAVEVDLSLAQVQLNINQAVPCSLIVNEVIVNALKHAFIEEETGKLSLHLSEQENQVQLTITDNGIGLPRDFSPKNHSSGTMIIQVLTEQLEGEYRYKNIKTGTQFSLTFEKNELKGSSKPDLL